MQVKVSVERLKKKYLERIKGKKDAMSYLCDSYTSTRGKAYRSKHANQNPN